MSLQQLFNADWYAAQNPDVAQAVARGQISPWQHFVQFGQFENRSPLAVFDADFYLQQNPDVAAAVREGRVTAAQHFSQFGQNEARLVAPSVDLKAYLQANPDVSRAVDAGEISALSHLVGFGLHEARDLGNGIPLNVFSSDTEFQQSLARGDMAQALARLDAVAPFLPDFAAPPGWTAKPDTPIPTDFVPPAGQNLKLVIPKGVNIPDGLTLPDTFQPVAGGGDNGAGGPPAPSLPGQALFTTTATTLDKNSSDASTALVLDDNYMVVADDEAAVLRVYSRDGGDAVAEWSIKTAAGAFTGTKAQLGANEIDIEGSTRIGDKLYFIGSHSNKKSGNDAPEREYLFSVTVTGTGADAAFSLADVTERGALTSALTLWDNTSAHGKGAGYYGLAASAGAGIVPEGLNGFSIEGLAASPDGSALYLGFRAPQAGAGSREKALIVSVQTDSVFGAAPAIGSAIELNLGGRGIRSIEQAADGSGYLILAGPAGSASADVTHDFRLYRWDGSSNASGQATGLIALEVRNGNGQTASLDSLLAATGGSFETLVEVKSTAAGTAVQLLQDNGDTLWAGQSQVSKDLPAGQQKFAGNWVTIGDAAVNTAPALAGSNIAQGASPIGSKADLVLRFDEAVTWGAGAITLKDGNDNILQTFSASDNTASFAYNTLTINPSNDLAPSGSYVLEFGSGAIQDLDGAAWSGTSLSFSVAAPVSHSLLVTEINSKHVPSGEIDFFELYNYGSTAIDLSNWRWTDMDNIEANASGSYGTFAAGTVLAAGGVLVVVTAKAQDAVAQFTAHWGAPSHSNALITQAGGPGLGKQDGIVVYDTGDNAAAWFNYTGQQKTALDGTLIASIPGGGDRHAGQAAGATDANASAIWDGVSPVSAPVYVAATTLTGAPLGTPGDVIY